MSNQYIKRPALVRLLERISPEPNTGCWLWLGRVRWDGYGQFYLGKVTTAHRASWQLHRGPIPQDRVLDHVCRTRSCVNPDHLRLVTLAQNTTENSASPSALNRSKYFCKRGHPLTGPNLGLEPKGRYCRACDRENGRAWNAANPERRRAIRLASYHRRKGQ